MLKNLKEFYSINQPFGPITSDEIEDPKIMEKLFSRENLIYRQISSCPSIISGRRGSGKTAFLRSVHLDYEQYNIIIELRPHQGFRHVINSIEEIRTSAVLVEEIAELWMLIFWNTIFIELFKQEKTKSELEVMGKYVDGLGLTRVRSPYSIMRKTVEILKAHDRNIPLSVVSKLIYDIAFNGVTFAEAKANAIHHMEKKGIKAIILLDSLEDFQLNDAKMPHAISGLLKCQGTFHFTGSPAEIRCCIPTELYHRLMAISSNPNKDFQKQILIRWHATELIKLAVQRYFAFLDIHFPEELASYKEFDLGRRRGAIAFMGKILPKEIKNRFGGTEVSLAYILRHTQLLPRQLLMYLNRIAVISMRKKDSVPMFNEKSILKGIYEVEPTICEEIFSAFKYVHPGARDACDRCLPYLTNHFDDGDLHRVYNRHGKNIENVLDYTDFKRLLIEIGAIGRVLDQTNRYVIGLFEYTVPHKLTTTTEDRLCMHPVFFEVFQAKKPENIRDFLPVYPYGTDLDGEEYRDFI
jgi:hypothetical protein